MSTETEVHEVVVGDPVRVVDEKYGEHIALVTAVHGGWSNTFPPHLNVVFVSGDATKTDPYGRQVDRLSSLGHYSTGAENMPRPGRYWVNV